MIEAVTENLAATGQPNFFANIPGDLKALSRWVLWKLEHGKDGKLTKVPYSYSGARASSTSQITWTTFDHAIQVYERGDYSGIGFVLSDSDDIVCVDLDDKEGNVDRLPEYTEIASGFNSFAEISYSGRGLHIWCRGRKPGNKCRRGELEVYERGRFIAVTGNHVARTPFQINNAQEAINEFYERITQDNTQGGKLPSPVTHNELSDNEIIRLASKNSHGFDSLWRGDFSKYPSQSEGDAALVCILAWYTKDPFQIDRLFRQSGLMREKWNRGDYRSDTISSGLQKVNGQYDPNYRKNTGRAWGDEFRREESHSQSISGPLTLTDLGNGERFKRFFGDSVRYCPPLKKWYVWNGRVWESDVTQRREILAIQTVRRIYEEAADEPDEGQRKRIAAWATVSESQQKRSAMLQTASSLLAIRLDELDARPDLFCLRNGTYNLETHEFREHRKEDLLTKMGGIEYVPGASCPTWEKHLDLIFSGDEDLINGFQELCGYALLSGNPDEIFVVCWGNGRNGKGKSFDAISHVFGDYAGTTAFSTFVHNKNSGGRGSASPELVDMIGTRLIVASEGEEGARLAEGLIKNITGSDPITARGLYQGFVTYRPEFMICLQTNHKPIIRNWDAAISARLWLVPFSVYIEAEDRDSHILEKFIAEGPGIFLWMAKGLKRYQSRGRLEQPDAVRRATDEYRQEQDRLGEFVSSFCIKAPGVWCYRKQLYDIYHADCMKNGVEPVSQNLFSRLLVSHHGVKEGSRRADGRTWTGITIKIDNDTSDTFSNNGDRKQPDAPVQQKVSYVSHPQEEEVSRQDTHQNEEIVSDTYDTYDTSVVSSLREENIEKSYGGMCPKCHSVTNLSDWFVHHQAAGLPEPDRYQIVDKPGASRCRCKDCSEPPLMAVNRMYHLCQAHFKEYRDLWEQEHQEGKE